jgi:hypothetical protein
LRARRRLRISNVASVTTMVMYGPVKPPGTSPPPRPAFRPRLREDHRRDEHRGRREEDDPPAPACEILVLLQVLLELLPLPVTERCVRHAERIAADALHAVAHVGRAARARWVGAGRRGADAVVARALQIGVHVMPFGLGTAQIVNGRRRPARSRAPGGSCSSRTIRRPRFSRRRRRCRRSEAHVPSRHSPLREQAPPGATVPGRSGGKRDTAAGCRPRPTQRRTAQRRC